MVEELAMVDLNPVALGDELPIFRPLIQSRGVLLGFSGEYFAIDIAAEQCATKIKRERITLGFRVGCCPRLAELQLVDPDRRVVPLDFGSARLLQPALRALRALAPHKLNLLASPWHLSHFTSAHQFEHCHLNSATWL